MKIFAIILAAILLPLSGGCKTAKYQAYSLAVAFVSEYKLVVKGGAGVEAQSDGIYGYAEGNGAILLGIWHKTTSQWIWHYNRDAGAIAEGYKMEWDFELGKPKIVTVSLQTAKDNLGSIPPPDSTIP